MSSWREREKRGTEAMSEQFELKQTVSVLSAIILKMMAPEMPVLPMTDAAKEETKAWVQERLMKKVAEKQKSLSQCSQKALKRRRQKEKKGRRESIECIELSGGSVGRRRR